MTDALQVFRESIDERGFAVLAPVLAASTLGDLTRGIETLAVQMDLSERGGIRSAFPLLPGLVELAAGDPLWAISCSVLGPETAAVRAIIFDKTPGANWKVVAGPSGAQVPMHPSFAVAAAEALIWVPGSGTARS